MSTVAVVIGGHPQAWEELAAIEAMAESAGAELHLCPLNACGLFVPRIDHWFIAQFMAAKPFVTAREFIVPGGGNNFRVHTPGSEAYPKMVEGHTYWPVDTQGTVAMFATRVLTMGMNYEKVVLTGVHISEKCGYFYGSPEMRFGYKESCSEIWEKNLDLLRRRVRSMGGWTEELLGRPERDWLKED